IAGASLDGRSPAWSFPADHFEEAILSKLAEVNPREVLGQAEGPDEVMVLSGELARVEAKIAELEAEVLNGEVAALAKVLRQQEARKKELAEKRAEAMQRAANPLSATWGECQSLLEALHSAPDPADARLRLRSALRRIIESVHVLVVPRVRVRVAAVQIRFAGTGRCRSYLIISHPTQANAASSREGFFTVFSASDVEALGDRDLRKPAHVRQLQKILAAVDVAALVAR